MSVCGGVSMMVAARPAQCFRLLRREPEWLTFALPLIAVTTVGNNDMWPYLAYVLPVVVVLVAACDTEWTNGLRGWMFSIATIATLVTQRSFERIRLDTYYSHWFPYYVIPSAAPDDLERLWLYWGRMMIVTAIAIWLMAIPETPRGIARASRRVEPVEADETAMRATL